MHHEWKRNHEAEINSAGKAPRFDSFTKLLIAVARLLANNKATFDALGPMVITPFLIAVGSRII